MQEYEGRVAEFEKEEIARSLCDDKTPFPDFQDRWTYYTNNCSIATLRLLTQDIGQGLEATQMMTYWTHFKPEKPVMKVEDESDYYEEDDAPRTPVRTPSPNESASARAPGSPGSPMYRPDKSEYSDEPDWCVYGCVWV